MKSRGRKFLNLRCRLFCGFVPSFFGFGGEVLSGDFGVVGDAFEFFAGFHFWVSLSVAGDRSGDDFLCSGDVGEFFDFGGAGFFEVFVVVEVEFNLFDELFWQVFECLVFVAVVAVVFGNDDDFVVDFAAVDEFHDAKNAGFEPNTGGQRLVGNDEGVKFVAVFVNRLRDEAVVARLREGDGLDAVEHEAGVFAVPFNFVVAAGRDFDDDVEFAFFVIAGG